MADVSDEMSSFCTSSKAGAGIKVMTGFNMWLLCADLVLDSRAPSLSQIAPNCFDKTVPDCKGPGHGVGGPRGLGGS